jgi:hypothetical protein
MTDMQALISATKKRLAAAHRDFAPHNQLNESHMMNTLNKAQQRDIAKIIVNGATLGDDYIARGLSALYRSALKTSQQNTILGLAIIYKVASNPEFITGRR